MFTPDPFFFHPGSDFFHPGYKVDKIPVPYPYPKKQFLSSRKNDLGYASRIRIFSISDPSRNQGLKKYWFTDPDPQHCCEQEVVQTSPDVSYF
jgi:hypothetical protein